MESLTENWAKYGYRPSILRKDLLTYVYEFIQPRIRELNIVLLKEDEIKALRFAIKIMLSFGITLNKNFGRDEMHHAFMPNFESLLWFKVLSKHYIDNEQVHKSDGEVDADNGRGVRADEGESAGGRSV